MRHSISNTGHLPRHGGKGFRFTPGWNRFDPGVFPGFRRRATARPNVKEVDDLPAECRRIIDDRDRLWTPNSLPTTFLGQLAKDRVGKRAPHIHRTTRDKFPFVGVEGDLRASLPHQPPPLRRSTQPLHPQRTGAGIDSCSLNGVLSVTRRGHMNRDPSVAVSNHPEHLERLSIKVARVVPTQRFPAFVNQTQRNAIGNPPLILKGQDRRSSQVDQSRSVVANEIRYC